MFSRIRLDLVVNVLVCKGLSEKVLPINGGEQWRPLLHVKDVAQATKFCLKNNISGLYNLGYKNFRIKDIALEIASHIQSVEIEFTDVPFEDLRNYRILNDKILDTGWTPKYSLQDGIEEMRLVISQGRIKNLLNTVYSNEKHLQELYREIKLNNIQNSGYTNKAFC